MMNEIKAELRVSPIGDPFISKVTRIRSLRWLFLIIPLGFNVFFLFYPMIDLFKLSVFNDQGFTMEYILKIFSSTVYLQVLWLTLKIALLVTVITLILAYPVAYFLIRMKSQTWKRLLFGAIMIPFWISLIVRTFAWTLLLQDQGVINKSLLALGLIDHPIPLLYNTTGVVIGMSHVLLPYMVLSLYSVMEGIDLRLLQAAEGMGARPMRAFIHVFFPLSLPGVLSGALLVFVLGIGYFITPALLGGANNMMLSMLISENISTTLNWNFASALALLLFVVTLFLLFIGYLLTRNNPVLKEVS